MIVVHHLNNSRSQRVLWLLEELGVPYEIKKYERDAATMLAPAALKTIHPLGKSPVLEDQGRIIAETGAIVEYVVETFGAGRLVPPRGTDAFLQYRYWLHFAEGSAMPPLLMKLIFGRVKETRMPFFVKPIANGIADRVLTTLVEPNLKAQMDFMESELKKAEWFAGPEFSAADVMMSFPLEAAAQRAGLTESAYPKLAGFVKKIHARPAYKKALERGGPYAFA